MLPGLCTHQVEAYEKGHAYTWTPVSAGQMQQLSVMVAVVRPKAFQRSKSQANMDGWWSPQLGEQWCLPCRDGSKGNPSLFPFFRILWWVCKSLMSTLNPLLKRQLHSTTFRHSPKSHLQTSLWTHRQIVGENNRSFFCILWPKHQVWPQLANAVRKSDPSCWTAVFSPAGSRGSLQKSLHAQVFANERGSMMCTDLRRLSCPTRPRKKWLLFETFSFLSPHHGWRSCYWGLSELSHRTKAEIFTKSSWDLALGKGWFGIENRPVIAQWPVFFFQHVGFDLYST